MLFRDHLPSDCPPSDSISVEIVVYCLVSGDHPVESDFLSYSERNPNRVFDDLVMQCQSCGLSVFTDLAGIELARKVSNSLRKKKLAIGYLSENSGKIKNTPSQNTGDTHHTWWPNREIDPSTLFKVL